VSSETVARARPTYASSSLAPFHLSAVIAVDAEDPKAAAFRALEVLTESLYLVCDQSTIRTFSYPPDAHVEYNGSSGKRVVRVRLDYTARWWNEDDRLCQAFLDLLDNKNLLEDDRRRFRTALEYLRLGGLASSPATAFAHNWVALESFASRGGSAMAEIRKYLPPLLCACYVRRLLSAFLDDCGRSSVDVSQVLGGVAPALRPKALLRVLKDPTAVQTLAQACATSELLRFRLSELAASFRDGASVAELLERHRTRLERHLQRIYRLRNAIVHAGETHVYVVPCLRHLSGYVQGALLETAARIAGGMRSVTEVLAMVYHSHLVSIDELRAQRDYDEQLALEGWLLS